MRDLPVSKDDVKNYMARVGSGSSRRNCFASFSPAIAPPRANPDTLYIDRSKPQLSASMPENSSERSSKRVLEPIDRVSEVLFGLIMVLTFTGSLSVAEAGRDDVRTMLIGALGCNLAWGIIDGVLYLMGCLAEKGADLLTFRAVRKATDPNEAQRLIADALPSVVASVLKPAELEAVHQRLKQLPEPPEQARLQQGRLAGCARRFSAGVPVHVSGGDSVHFHAQRRAGPARLQCHRHRDVVSDGLRFRTHDRASPVAGGYFDGCSRIDSGGHDHGAGRMKQMRLFALIAFAVVLAGDNALAQERRTRPTQRARRPRSAKKRTRKPGLSRPPPPPTSCLTIRNMCSRRSPRTAAGCISRLATTTRTSKRDRRGSATISAAAKNWSGNSRRCWAACLAIRPASRPATSFRLLIGSSSFPVKASGSSTRAIRREASSTTGPS